MTILEVLQEAKKFYQVRIDNGMAKYSGMCYCIAQACPEYSYHDDTDIYSNETNQWIPEFNREFLGAALKEGDYYWNVEDYESRLRAFDLLIDVYKKKESDRLEVYKASTEYERLH